MLRTCQGSRIQTRVRWAGTNEHGSQREPRLTQQGCGLDNWAPIEEPKKSPWNAKGWFTWLRDLWGIREQWVPAGRLRSPAPIQPMRSGDHSGRNGQRAERRRVNQERHGRRVICFSRQLGIARPDRLKMYHRPVRITPAWTAPVDTHDPMLAPQPVADGSREDPPSSDTRYGAENGGPD